MKIAILITAYNLPDQLDLLLGRLTQDFDVYLHADTRFEYAREFPNLYRTAIRYRSEWASYEQILSIIELFRSASGRGHYDRYVLISGQDVPCASNDAIRIFFSQHPASEYIHGWDVSADDWNGNGSDRVRLFWLPYAKKLPDAPFARLAARGKRRAAYVLERGIHFIQKTFSLYRPFALPMFVGSNWMDLTGECVDYVLRYIDQHPEYLKSFRHTRCGVEMFFHTIIFNSPYFGNIVHGTNRFVDFHTGPDKPRVLRSEDENAILNSGLLFARKLDRRVDPVIVDALYARTAR